MNDIIDFASPAGKFSVRILNTSFLFIPPARFSSGICRMRQSKGRDPSGVGSFFVFLVILTIQPTFWSLNLVFTAGGGISQYTYKSQPPPPAELSLSDVRGNREFRKRIDSLLIISMYPFSGWGTRNTRARLCTRLLIRVGWNSSICICTTIRIKNWN